MNKEQQLQRTKRFAFNVIKLTAKLSEFRIARIIGDQLLRSGTSVGANYRAACRAKSSKDFINKMKIVEEEADETLYWLELLEQANLISQDELLPIKTEANELLAIFVAALKSAKRNLGIY